MKVQSPLKAVYEDPGAFDEKPEAVYEDPDAALSW